MAKTRTRFVCENCGAAQPRWMGRCPECNEWNTMVETIMSPPSSASTSTSQRASRAFTALDSGKAQPLSAISTQGDARLEVSIGELSRVLGGGVVPGSVVLISGDPGIGKSTLLLQLTDVMARDGEPVLYVSGEESLHQIKLRAERLDLHTANILILAETNLERILNQIQTIRPRMVIVDSVQSIYSEQLNSSAGSVSQVRECAAALLRLAKAQGIPTFLVGHVTKTGNIAGPRVLEHIVDTVLYLEGERFHTYRLLRSVKNRFGSTNEVGVFEMRDKGLIEVTNPSQVFLEERMDHATGSAVAITMEGTRPLLVEIQALVSKGGEAHPRRTGNGIDVNRLLLLTAVLSKRVGLRLSDQDIFVNVVGGLRVSEPAVDLAIATAVASSYYNRAVRKDLAIFGEVGLAGELRSVSQSERRLSEAAKLGFTQGLMPTLRRSPAPKMDGLTVHSARSLTEAIHLALEPGQPRQDA